MYGPFVSLPADDYTLVIAYDCESEQRVKPYASGFDENYIEANSINLEEDLHSTSYDFRLTAPVEKFEIRFFYDGQGVLRINEVKLLRNLNKYKRSILLLCILFLTADICFIERKKLYTCRRRVISLAAIVFICSLPVLVKGILYPVEDIDFHLMRIEGLAEELSLGHFPSRIQAAWDGGNGYPVSVFYGDILLYLPAFLHLAGFTVSFCYGTYLIFINTLTVLIAYFSFKCFIKDTYIPFIMTFAYVTANSWYVTIYVRGALAEYTAMAFLPLGAAALYLLFTDSEKKAGPNVRASIMLAVAMTGIVTSHILSAEMSVVAIILLCLLNIKKMVRPRVILTFAASVIETALLALFFIVPFLDYYLNMDILINQKSEDPSFIQGGGIYLFQLFSFFQNPYVVGNSAKTPGVLLMSAFLLGAAVWAFGKANRKIKISIVFSAIIMFVCTNVFPWNWLADKTSIFSVLANIQFPLRYMEYACISLTVLLGFLLEQLKHRQEYWGRIQLREFAAIAVINAVIGLTVLFGYSSEKAVVYHIYDGAELSHTTQTGAEYVRVYEDGEPVTYVRKDAEGINASVETVSREGWTLDMKVSTGDSEGIVKTPYSNYKGYRAYDDQGNSFEIYDDEYCKAAFNVPAGYSGLIEFTFVEPWYWRLSEIVSIVAWAGLIFFIVGHERNAKRKEAQE